MSKSSMYYHIRPTKVIDRMLFLELLTKLKEVCPIPIQKYQYIGFGAESFEDFKLVHRQLEINDMISLEFDKRTYLRQQFNRPYECIQLINKSSADFIREYEFDNPTIIWLDYCDAGQIREQISEICALIGKMEENDILKVTFNANPSAYGTPKNEKDEIVIENARLEELRSRVGEYLSSPINHTAVKRKNLPQTLIDALKNAVNNECSKEKQMLPLSTCVYADGQQMVTFTGMIYRDKNKVMPIREMIETWPHGGDIADISIPALTIKERIEMNALLPGATLDQIKGKEVRHAFEKDSDIENYIKYYKYYPNYHQIMY